MTSFQDAPDKAIEADEAKEACCSYLISILYYGMRFFNYLVRSKNVLLSLQLVFPKFCCLTQILFQQQNG